MILTIYISQTLIIYELYCATLLSDVILALNFQSMAKNPSLFSQHEVVTLYGLWHTCTKKSAWRKIMTFKMITTLYTTSMVRNIQTLKTLHIQFNIRPRTSTTTRTSTCTRYCQQYLLLPYQHLQNLSLHHLILSVQNLHPNRTQNICHLILKFRFCKKLEAMILKFYSSLQHCHNSVW